jgi:hypothetical protein
MAAAPPRSARPRARPGSLDRPVNGRLYRSTWLLFGLPLLVAAFSVVKPQALRPAQPALPPSFDRGAALAAADDLARTYPDRAPGSPGARGAAGWFASQLEPYGLRVRRDEFSATIPDRGRVRLTNLTATVPGRSPQALVVMAHLDDTGAGPGANDNASGIGTLLELARFYAASTGGGARAALPAHTILFVATDGGAFGAIGADHFTKTYRGRVLAVVVLDSVAGHGRPHVLFGGSEPRSPALTLVETAAERLREQTGAAPARMSVLGQLIDLGFPFSLYEQAPLVAHGIPAVTLTTAGPRPPSPFGDSSNRLSEARLGQLGRAAQELLRSLDQGAELAQGTSSYLYLGPRVIRGWAVELVLVAALLPFLIAVVDLFARCRRRRIPLTPAMRSYRGRLGFWLWTGGIFLLFAVVGVWPRGTSLPVAPDTHAAGHWPLLGVAGLVVLAALGWLVARERLLPRRPLAAEEELAGYTAALLLLGLIGILVVATNPFALVFLLPSLHAWLWLPQVRSKPAWARAAVLAAGFVGPALLVGSFATRYGLGLDAPWYLAELVALGYVPLTAVVIALAWLAVASQLTALAAGRYAPYPAAAERPRLGPIRSVIRRLLLVVVMRRRASESVRRALEG